MNSMNLRLWLRFQGGDMTKQLDGAQLEQFDPFLIGREACRTTRETAEAEYQES